MNMDARLRGFPCSANGIELGNSLSSVLPNNNLVSGSEFVVTNVDDYVIDFDHHPPDPKPTTYIVTPPSCPNVTQDENFPEDCDFSDTVLRYISQMLMEEERGDGNCMCQDSLDLHAAENSFYEVLGKKYHPSPEPILSYFNQIGQCPCYNLASCCNHTGDISCSNDTSGYLDEKWNHTQQSLQVNYINQSSQSAPISAVTSMEGLIGFPSSTFQVSDCIGESQPILQFRKGIEEASKFLPTGSGFFCSIGTVGSLSQEPKASIDEVAIKVEKKDDGECFIGGSRGKKNPHWNCGDMGEERSSKQLAASSDSNLPAEAFDKLLLYNEGEGLTEMENLRRALKNFSIDHKRFEKSKVSTGRKGHGRKDSSRKEDVVDLRTLLMTCAQAVAENDWRHANELLKKIRQHSFSFGDGNQRLAHCFANGLEARLAGTGSQIYKGLSRKKTSAADILKAYHLYLAACPFKKVSNFVSNKTICNISANSSKLHIIDFGILYGFQWPTFIQRLSMQPGGPPKLRITGIDFPQPGFRPKARVEDTGLRLAAYAVKFGVSFEYNAIAKNWESIQLEELKIDRDEVIVVTCFYRAKNLPDEMVAANSPRNIVLNLIRKIKPEIFIHGIINGAFNAPFFVTRFREALFHFSALFDMLEAVVPREDQERMLIEKEIFGGEALNVIACEGWERVERPETYKQWQVRCMRAGFMQLHFDQEIMKYAISKARKRYHSDFLVDEDGKWLLQGWKGRVIYCLSAWKAA